MKMLTSRSITANQTLWITLAALVIVIIAWNVPALSPVLYPFRLFVTFVHEAGHGIAAKLSGGEVIGFVVSSDGSGVATTAGGSRWLILPAGYLGAALFGAALLYSVNTISRARWIAAVLGVGLIAFTAAYARPENNGAPTALLVGAGFGAALLLAAWKLADHWTRLGLNVLAMLTGLNAVLDLKSVFENSGASLGQVRNDAAAFSAEVLGLPAAVWALLWAVLAVTLLGMSVYYSIYRPLLMRKPQARTTDPVAPNHPAEDSIMDILKRDR